MTDSFAKPSVKVKYAWDNTHGFIWMYIALCGMELLIKVQTVMVIEVRAWVCNYILLFLPEARFGLRVLSLPASVRPSVRPSITKIVRTITHHLFKLGSPNLDQRYKTPWLRCFLFWGAIVLDLQGQI